MNSQTQLSATQAEILKVASYRPDGNIEPLPPALRGGARTKVIGGLLSRALIEARSEGGSERYVLTDAAFAAVGRQRKAPVANSQDPEIDATVAKDVADVAANPAGKPRTRENSKQALVIEMLKRPEGATIRQICEATGWLAHTVRGTFAGAFKKKLGLNITSAKADGEERIYSLCD